MAPRDLQFFYTADLAYASVCILDDDVLILYICTKIQYFLSTERNRCCVAFFYQFPTLCIIIVENAVLILRLIFEDTCFRIDIILHSLMTIQMIRCQIQDSRNFRAKIPNGFQLKAAGFRNEPAVFFR